MAARAPLLVVDGDSLGHRAYHAMPPVKGPDGVEHGLLLGFANMLLAAHAAEAPRAVLIGLDARTRSYRHELLPDYQGKRERFEEPLQRQLDLLPELAGAFGFAWAKQEPYEADDFLAAGVAFEEAAGGRALVLTSDRDSFQLVSDRTEVLMPPGKAGAPLVRVGRPEVRERYGVEPEQVIDLIALRGDPSDNIPGARGIGPKTAAELLRRYGTLDEVIARARELSPRQALTISSGADDLRRYRQVATMQRDAPLPPLDDNGLDRERAADWAEAQGIASLAQRLRGR
jgi:DNA polymerase-1